MSQAGRSRDLIPSRSIAFSMDLIFPTSLRPWGQLSLWHKWVPGTFLGLKGDRCLRLTNLLPDVSRLSRNCGGLDVSKPYGSPLLCMCNYAFLCVDLHIVTYTIYVCGSVTNNSTTRVRIGSRIYSLWRFTAAHITITDSWHNNSQLIHAEWSHSTNYCNSC
jgi:hypothetical protein